MKLGKLRARSMPLWISVPAKRVPELWAACEVGAVPKPQQPLAGSSLQELASTDCGHSAEEVLGATL